LGEGEKNYLGRKGATLPGQKNTVAKIKGVFCGDAMEGWKKRRKRGKSTGTENAHKPGQKGNYRWVGAKGLSRKQTRGNSRSPGGVRQGGWYTKQSRNRCRRLSAPCIRSNRPLSPATQKRLETQRTLPTLHDKPGGKIASMVKEKKKTLEDPLNMIRICSCGAFEKR